MTASALARALFAPPGAAAAHTRHLLAQAAGAHARLLDSTASGRQQPLDRLRDAMARYLRSSASAPEKRFVLDDPQLVEALHGLASTSGVLTDWDATVAPGCMQTPREQRTALGQGRLGNIVVALLLRRSRDWCGRIELATDDYGRIHIPFCDWAVVLVDHRGTQRELLAHQKIALELGTLHACWTLVDEQRTELVRMPREVFDAMFLDNRDSVGVGGVECCTATIRPRFERATPLGQTRIRFEPISGEAPAAHAALTGGIVAALLSAIEQNARPIHRQLCQCIRVIHGFELPAYANGQIASFSVPTSPGVIGFNVQFNAADEPCLSPYCFMWLGHELGHTLNYLIDDVAYTHGWRFLENPGDTTPVLPRYGRSLGVRTLFQVPYVHLFEWWLLMLFCEHGFAGLPWQVGDDARAVGDDVRAEIDEAFGLIEQHARLTVMGHAVVARMRELVAEAEARWRLLSHVATGRRAKVYAESGRLN